MHAQTGVVKSKLSTVEVEALDTVQGSELYHNLMRLIGHNHDTTYLLKITLSQEVTSPLAITHEASVVEQNVAQLYFYSLMNKETGKIVDEGKIRLASAYNALSTPYASYTKEQSTKKNLSQAAAEELYMRLMLYFGKQR